MGTANCLSRADLKRYLAGWVEEPLSAVIEQHLRECGACEQTIVDLEANPDTLPDSLRRSGPNEPSGRTVKRGTPTMPFCDRRSCGAPN